MKIYFAAPLFSEAGRDWIRSTSSKIKTLAAERVTKMEVCFPYDLITQEEMDSLRADVKHEIFSQCKSRLHNADRVIALLDGTRVDTGTSWEIGYFYRGKREGGKIIGIRADFRNGRKSSRAVVKAMVECVCDRIVRSSEELITVLSGFFDDASATKTMKKIEM